MNRMPEYEFRVLCADGKASCTYVKSLMKDFKNIADADMRKPYDHTGVIEAKNSNAALQKEKELKKIAGNAIRNIEIALL